MLISFHFISSARVMTVIFKPLSLGGRLHDNSTTSLFSSPCNFPLLFSRVTGPRSLPICDSERQYANALRWEGIIKLCRVDDGEATGHRDDRFWVFRRVGDVEDAGI